MIKALAEVGAFLLPSFSFADDKEQRQKVE